MESTVCRWRTMLYLDLSRWIFQDTQELNQLSGSTKLSNFSNTKDVNTERALFLLWWKVSTRPQVQTGPVTHDHNRGNNVGSGGPARTKFYQPQPWGQGLSEEGRSWCNLALEEFPKLRPWGQGRTKGGRSCYDPPPDAGTCGTAADVTWTMVHPNGSE